MGGSLWWVPPSPVDSRGPGGADALLTLKCHQCFLFFCHLGTAPPPAPLESDAWKRVAATPLRRETGAMDLLA